MGIKSARDPSVSSPSPRRADGNYVKSPPRPRRARLMPPDRRGTANKTEISSDGFSQLPELDSRDGRAAHRRSSSDRPVPGQLFFISNTEGSIPRGLIKRSRTGPRTTSTPTRLRDEIPTLQPVRPHQFRAQAAPPVFRTSFCRVYRLDFFCNYFLCPP